MLISYKYKQASMQIGMLKQIKTYTLFKKESLVKNIFNRGYLIDLTDQLYKIITHKQFILTFLLKIVLLKTLKNDYGN